MIRAICFDFDGVLVDLPDVHREALRSALEQCVGIELTREQERDLEGLSTHEKLRRLNLSPEDAEQVWKAKQDETQRQVDLLQPDPVKIGMLCGLRDRGFLLACVSNSIRMTTERALIATTMKSYFGLILSNQDVVHQKPAPDPYNAAFFRLGVKPEEAVCVEDAEHGRESARRSGGHLLAVDSYDEVNFGLVDRFIRSL